MSFFNAGYSDMRSFKLNLFLMIFMERELISTKIVIIMSSTLDARCLYISSIYFLTDNKNEKYTYLMS